MTDNPRPQSPASPSPRTLLAMIFAGLLVWGLYIAGGVLWYGLNPLGALVVMVCVGLFLGFWGIMLKMQKRNK